MSLLSHVSRVTMLAAALVAGTAPAQIRTVDPSAPDVAAARSSGTTPAPETPAAAGPIDPPAASAPRADEMPPPSGEAGPARTALSTDATFQNEEIFGVAERTFGKGAQGLAKVVENILAKQGRPTAYIGGREAGGAIGVGLRYGQGDLFHKVEGQQPIHWSGPSLGFDIGGAGSKVLILVYNLHDSADMFKRFPLVEGNLYAVGGFTASYLRRGDVVLVPIRLGVGWRFGASVGYMNFTHEGRVLPF